MKTKVTLRGQVSVPSSIRKQFGMDSESMVLWQTEGNTIRVIPIPKDPISTFKGKGSGKYSTEKMIRDRQNDRKKER